jgi:peptidoglycan/xylan/chitin deacetylase (PgdA/CDA1 family)
MSGRPVVFVRCDDVGDDSRGLAAVHDAVLAAGVPCAFACIPARLKGAALRRLDGPDTGTDTDGVSLHQHGFTHTRHRADGVDREDELVGYRTAAAQRSAIALGREILRDRVGRRLDPDTFTPPRHRYNEATVVILRELGFRRLSAGVYFDRASQLVYRLGRRLGLRSLAGRGISLHDVAAPDGLVEVSTSVNVDLHRSGKPRPLEPDTVLAEIDAAVRHTATVGLLLHHTVYDDEPARGRTLRELLTRVRASHEVVDLRDLPRERAVPRSS